MISLLRFIHDAQGARRLLAAPILGCVIALAFWLMSAIFQAVTMDGGDVRLEIFSPPKHHLYQRVFASLLFGVGASTLLLWMAQKTNSEQALTAVNARVSSLVENLNEMVFSLNPAGEFTYVSPVVERLTGYRSEELVGAHFSKLFHAADLEAMRERFARVLCGEVTPHETAMRTKDGSTIWIRISSRAVCPDGHPTEVIGVLTDTTALHQAEGQLRRLWRAVEASPSVVVITDVRGNIEYVNPKFTTLTGYSLDEARGKHTRILKSGEMAPEAYKDLWETISAGREWRGEFHNRRKNGTLYWEFATISAVRDERGNVVEYVAVKEDITARRAAEHALAESEEKYRMLFNSQFDAVALLDPETKRYLEANDAHLALMGYSRDELEFQSSLTVHDVEQGDEDVCGLALQRGTTYLPNRTLRRRDGSMLPVDVALGVFTWKDKPVVFTVVRDISERVRYSELLEKLSRTDALTELANRRAFDERLELEWRRAFRDELPISLVMVDVDDFKIYNDTHGHLEGDACLQRVAEGIRSVVRRPADLAARYGGEEFAAILTGTPEQGAMAVAEAMRRTVELLGIPHGASRVSPVVTLSCGVATLRPWHGGTPEELVGAADQALYRAKSGGRNRVVAVTDLSDMPANRVLS